MKRNGNLSDTRGNKWGVGFFRRLVGIVGLRNACRFVWVVALFYALFDSQARARAARYISMRFPQANVRGQFWIRFWHTYRLFVSQGQMLLFAAFHDKVKFNRENYTAIKTRLDTDPEGVILLSSHFGAWRNCIFLLLEIEKKTAVLEEPDQNTEISKFRGLEGIGERVFPISTHGFMGGLMDALEFLDAGQNICIMGDRAADGDTLVCRCWGHDIPITISPWYLAAKTGKKILPLFAVADLEAMELHFHTMPSIQFAINTKPSKNELHRYAQTYVDEFQKMSEKHPYLTFYF